MLVGAVIFAFSLPIALKRKMQMFFVSFLIPFAAPLHSSNHSFEEQEIALIRLENQLLRDEIALLQEQLNLCSNKLSSTTGLIGRVIFRPLSTWATVFWIDLGTENSGGLVGEESPVVVNNAVVGIVESAGRTKSLVRLISDPNLTPSVRVMRDGVLLAKGEICGIDSSGFLIGKGFNYDFSDTNDLLNTPKTQLNIVQEGDLLVTTGMDGVFPPYLNVGTVVNVDPLAEGGITRSLRAIPAVQDLSYLRAVIVLPRNLSENHLN